MRQHHDLAAYEELQAALASGLVSEIRGILEAAGLRGSKLQTTVASIASSVADIYDGSAHVQAKNDYLVPILGFAIGRMRTRLLVPEEGGSSVHEFIPGAVSSEFGAQ